MKREIFCRAKRSDTGTWVFGSYVSELGGKHYIIQAWSYKPELWDYFEVLPSTVGQFTGLTDKNGTKIFEGDILTNNSQDDIIAGFYNGCFINSNTYITLHTEIKDPISRQISFEITSNIHDNPTT